MMNFREFMRRSLSYLWTIGATSAIISAAWFSYIAKHNMKVEDIPNDYANASAMVSDDVRPVKPAIASNPRQVAVQKLESCEIARGNQMDWGRVAIADNPQISKWLDNCQKKK